MYPAAFALSQTTTRNIRRDFGVEKYFVGHFLTSSSQGLFSGSGGFETAMTQKRAEDRRFKRKQSPQDHTAFRGKGGDDSFLKLLDE